MMRLAFMFLGLACLGGMIILMPEAVAALPFRDRMWCYGLGIVFFVMGALAAPQRT